MRQLLCNYFKNEDGVTAIEYGLIAALICLAIIGSMKMLGAAVMANLYNKIGDAVLGNT